MKLAHHQQLWFGAVLLASGVTVLANGFRLPDQDAQATARGEAFVATADNPSAVYYNPAGLTQLEGHNVRMGVYGLSFTTEFESPSGSSSETKDAMHLIPQFFYSYKPEKLPLSFGLGVYAPFGMQVEWPEDTGFRTIALQSDLSCMTVNPVVAWRVLPTLSIAAGPTFNWSELDLKQGVTPYPGNDLLHLNGDGFAVGFNAGILWQPTPMWSFGATYRSPFDVDYTGETDMSFEVPPPGYPPHLNMDNETSVPFPQSVAVGLSFRPTPKWNLEFNADWTSWSRLDTIYVHQAIPSQLVLNWENSWYYEFGLTRDIGKGWYLSGGYIYNQNSVPGKTFNPFVPDQDRQFVSAGVGFRGEHFGFDFAYQYGFAGTSTVSGSTPSAAGQSADGDYDYKSQAFALSVGWHF